MLITGADRTVPVTAQTRVRLSPATAFERVVPIDLTLVFQPWGPVPGVAGVRDQTGAWDRPGATRTPVLTDGSTAREALTEYSPGHAFAYEITGMTNALGRVLRGVRGEWTFTADGPGAVVRWTYEFLPARRALVAGVVVPVWRRYQARCLAAVVRVIGG